MCYLLLMAEVKTLVTAEQFYKMNLQDVRAELVDGEVVTMSLPGGIHGRVCIRIARPLDQFVSDRNLGWVVSEVGFILKRQPDLVRGPDVAFLSKEKVQAQKDPHKLWEGPPDLAVEVLSPDDRPSEVLRKVGEYLEAGTRLVWVVDPKNQTVSAHRGLHRVRVYGVGEELSGEDVLPGFSLKVADIFA